MLWRGCADAGAGTAGEQWSPEERSASMQIPDPFIKACVEQGVILGVRNHERILHLRCAYIAVRRGC